MINYDDATTRYDEFEDGLIGKWTMDLADYDSDTSTLKDYSVYENGAVNNGATFVTGKDGVANTAMRFNGAQSLTLPNDPIYYLTPNQDQTICGWFKANQSSATQAIFDSRFSVGGNVRGYFVSTQTSNMLRAWIYIGSSSQSRQTSTAITHDTWYHYAAVIDRSDKISLYLNAELKSSTSIADFAATDLSTGVSPKIGMKSYSGSSITPFIGDIGKTRIYNKALTIDEITQDMEDFVPYLTYDGFMARGVKQVDSIKVSDTTNKTLTRTLVDTLNVSDTGDRQLEIKRSTTDSLSVSETFKKSLTRTVKDILSVAETFKKSLSRIIKDTLEITDKAFKTIKTTVIDTINISDTASKIATFYRSAIDRIGASEKFKHCKNGIELIWSRLTNKPTTNYNKENKPTTSWDNPDKPNRC